MDNEKISVDLETLLAVTRQKLVSVLLANTELEALVQELQVKVSKLEAKTKEV